MAQTFEEITRKVVDRFLQNILFIDDNAYSDNKENAFDAQEISSVFAKNGKLCTVYAPHHENDISNCISLFAKADVVVLDWYLNLETNLPENNEADADEDDPRGKYTKYLIKAIVEEAKDEKLKLVIVYTGDGDKLKEITNKIYENILNNGEYTLTEEDCRIDSSNMVILVRAKYNGEDQFKHIEYLKDKVIKYEDLPDFIISVFAKHVDGLLPNFALMAISMIRENTSRILNVYSSELDIAYLGHKTVLPNKDDSKKLLMKLFGESITDLISSIDTDTQDWLSLWIESRFSESKTINVSEKKAISVDKDIVGKLLVEHFDDFDKYIKTQIPTLSNNDIRTIHNNATMLFCNNVSTIKKANILFAKLTHHKNVFLPKAECPILTLGTVIRSIKKNNYYLCIQQNCDSLRIDGERRFLFLPLVKTGGETHIIINDNNYQVAKSTFQIKTIRFEADKAKKCVCSKRVERTGNLVFTSIYNEEYEWVMELKELHAQRILNSYCANLARIGIDESEWLRLLS